MWFLQSFSGIQKNRLCVGKSLVQASCTENQKPRSNKKCILRIRLSQKCNWRFSHVFLHSKDDSDQRWMYDQLKNAFSEFFFPELKSKLKSSLCVQQPRQIKETQQTGSSSQNLRLVAKILWYRYDRPATKT